VVKDALVREMTISPADKFSMRTCLKGVFINVPEEKPSGLIVIKQNKDKKMDGVIFFIVISFFIRFTVKVIALQGGKVFHASHNFVLCNLKIDFVGVIKMTFYFNGGVANHSDVTGA
jgi:hypothetical protein